MSASNYVKNIAIVGASGNSGSHMTRELLKTGKHTVTALTRVDSTSKLPEGVIVKSIDYENPSTIVDALRGQEVLIITLSVTAPKDTQAKLVQAAAEAGVAWVLPNEWSPDSSNDALVRDAAVFRGLRPVHQAIRDTGVCSFIAVTCGYWYEWSLAIPLSYGFDFKKREVVFFDDGRTRINTSTWPQVGRAVAALLSLPVKPEGGDEKERCLEHFRNGYLRFSSFLVSQEDMFESVLRVTETTRDDWNISHEPSRERWAKATEDMNNGDRSGYVREMYTRVFFPDGAGDYETSKGIYNEMLGLPKEDLDSATGDAIQRAKESPW